MTYDLSAVGNATNIVELYAATNTASANMLSYLVLMSIFIILLMILLRNNFVQESILASSMVCMILSLIFLAFNAVPIIAFTAFAVIAAGAAVSLYINK
jgi:cellulose synthase/poly-beta-1,6-N-acetylglucosamine synthase-like glycosyltransferase